MRSSVSLVAMLLAGCGTGAAPAAERREPAGAPAPSTDPALPPEIAAPTGPSGTAGAGPQSYDRVGLASWYGDLEQGATTAMATPFDPDAVAAAHRTLPLGSIAEVTSLDTGRTILVRITDRGPHDPRYEIDLTRGAAALLGTDGGATPVRVRAVGASAADASALARGKAASPRMDAPPALLAALRRQLLAASRVPTPTPAPATPGAAARGATRPPARGRLLVQVAAFSTQPRAVALARALGGSVEAAGALWRVRLGPFADAAAAQRARDGAARRGYGDAKIIPSP